MRRRGPTFWGAAVGVLAAVLLSATLRPRPEPTGPMLGEHGGRICSVVMQYTRGAAFVWPVYRQFLVQQASGVRVYVACPGAADFDELRAAVRPVACTLKSIYTGHVMTAWARDRWVVLLPAAPGGNMTLLAPQGELQQEVWPQRAGDARVAADLAQALKLRARRSTLYFDGGDYLCDGPWVFVAPAVLKRNLQHTVGTRAGLLAAIAFDLHRQAVLMDDAPDHHAGMVMMAAGAGRMVVGDPSLGARLFAADSTTAPGLDGGPDFTAATQHRFDSVARLAADHGFQVYRIPVVPALHGKMYLTYVNVIMDECGGRPVVYMPVYQGQAQMNAAARGLWEQLGYAVRPIDCTTVWQRGGTLHCLVNVLARS